MEDKARGKFMVEQMCAILGVKVKEKWVDISGHIYQIYPNGEIEVSTINNGKVQSCQSGYCHWEDIFTGITYPFFQWRPSTAEPCYNTRTQAISNWTNTEQEQLDLKQGYIMPYCSAINIKNALEFLQMENSVDTEQ